MEQSHPLLKVQNLSLEFHKPNGEIIEILKNISFSLEAGETLGIVGESGSGKSVTALSIMRLLPFYARFTNGHLMFEGADLRYATEKDLQSLRGKQITMIFQEPMTSLNPVLTCGYQIEEMFLVHDRQKKSYKDEVLKLLEEVQIDQPERAYHAYPHQLSGGQKQRVMIAMAIATRPKLLIADEPTTALDVTVQQGILELLLLLQQKYQMAMIFISHDLAVVKQLCKRIVVMYQGKIVEQGGAHEILSSPKHAYTQALLACRPNPAKFPERLYVLDDFLTIQNHELIPKAPPSIPLQNKQAFIDTFQERKPLLKVDNLSVWYPYQKNFWGKVLTWKKAVQEVSFTLHEGETLGLVGESGCGKSTISKAIVHLIKPTSGKIYFQDTCLTDLNDSEWLPFRKKIQMVFQDPYASLNPKMKIGEAILEPMYYHKIYPSYKECREQTLVLLEQVGLKSEHFDRYPHEFSGGQRQRICIARALALKPQILICDESVSALDVSVQAQILNLLNQIKKEHRISFLFISHDLNVVQYFCDRIMVMQQGQIVESHFSIPLMQNPQHPYTQQLLKAIPTL